MAAGRGGTVPNLTTQLPPSPLTADGATRPRVIHLLPCYTPLLTACVGVPAGLVSHYGYLYLPFVQVPVVRYVVALTALMGFGPCLADRQSGGRDEPLRRTHG